MHAHPNAVTGTPDQKTGLQRTVLCVEDSTVGYSEPKFIVIRFFLRDASITEEHLLRLYVLRNRLSSRVALSVEQETVGGYPQTWRALS